MSVVWVKLASFTSKYPVTRGMAAYAVIWPISSLCQQTIAGKSFKELDYVQAARFSFFGGFFVAPTLNAWIKFAGNMWPTMSLKSAVSKALVEQVTYGPAAMICFFFGMSLLEGRSVGEAADEVKAKFLPTYRVGVCFWPILQTINFSLIPARNRVIFVSVCSLMWTSFLAYMKQLDAKETKNGTLGQILPVVQK